MKTTCVPGFAAPASIEASLRKAESASPASDVAAPATAKQTKAAQWILPTPSIVVRKGSERDYPAIARIQQTCPEAAQWPVGDYSAFETLVAYSDGQPAGFCAWRQTAPGEAELLNLGVHPAARRQGVASALLDALCTQAQGDIFLEVAEPNTPAIQLYTKQGWLTVAIRKGYYEGGKINAVVMKKRSW
jgi:ribosomal protein S18 acetylase RimI-like enzyme